MSTDIKKLLDTIKSKQYFDIEVELTEPLRFKGVVPFDMRIEGTKASFKVLAESEVIAESMVFNFLMSLDE